MEYVTKKLNKLVDRLSSEDKIVGEPENREIRLPIELKDKRKLTWRKLADKIGKKITNSPTHQTDCWYINCNDNGYHQTKISNGTSGEDDYWEDKYQTHVIMYLLKNPEMYTDVYHMRKNSKCIAHRCHRGKGRFKGDDCCVNPYHLILSTNADNERQKGCKFGHRAICPHETKCIYTWKDSGLRKKCFNSDELKECTCDKKCIHDLSE